MAINTSNVYVATKGRWDSALSLSLQMLWSFKFIAFYSHSVQSMLLAIGSHCSRLPVSVFFASFTFDFTENTGVFYLSHSNQQFTLFS